MHYRFQLVNDIIMSKQFYLCPYVSPNVRSLVPSVLKLKLSPALICFLFQDYINIVLVGPVKLVPQYS